RKAAFYFHNLPEPDRNLARASNVGEFETQIQERDMSITTSVKKASRKVEKAVTGTEPEADLLDTLKEEHEEVSALLKKLTDEDSSARERRSLVTQIKAALVPHVKAEQKILYDAIIALKDKEAQKDGEEGYIEHALASKTLADLEKLSDANAPEFLAT